MTKNISWPFTLVDIPAIQSCLCEPKKMAHLFNTDMIFTWCRDLLTLLYLSESDVTIHKPGCTDLCVQLQGTISHGPKLSLLNIWTNYQQSSQEHVSFQVKVRVFKKYIISNDMWHCCIHILPLPHTVLNWGYCKAFPYH